MPSLVAVAKSTAIPALLVIACAPTTQVVAAWKDPGVDRVQIGRALLVFEHDSEALRRSVEDALAARMPGAVPAYTMFSTDEIFDAQRVRARVTDEGFNTVIITRLVDVEREVQWSPGVPGPMFYGPLWGGWGWGWQRVYQPGYLDTTTIVTLETLIYALDPQLGEEGSLIWASRSETFDPRSVRDLTASVVRASARAMEREGLFVQHGWR